MTLCSPAFVSGLEELNADFRCTNNSQCCKNEKLTVCVSQQRSNLNPVQLLLQRPVLKLPTSEFNQEYFRSIVHACLLPQTVQCAVKRCSDCLWTCEANSYLSHAAQPAELFLLFPTFWRFSGSKRRSCPHKHSSIRPLSERRFHSTFTLATRVFAALSDLLVCFSKRGSFDAQFYLKLNTAGSSIVLGGDGDFIYEVAISGNLL